MESIISPWFMYLILMADALRSAFVGFAILSGMASVAYLVGIAVNRGLDEEDSIEHWVKGWGKLKNFVITLAIVFIPLAIFMPSKNTLIAMYVANEVTYDRVEKAGEIAGDIKEAVKRDIMDIIRLFDEDTERSTDENNK